MKIGNSEEHRQAAACRADAVLPVERHHLFLLLLAHLLLLLGRHPRLHLVLVPHLEQLRLEELHLHHRAGAFARQWEDDDHRHQCQQDDGDPVAVAEAVEGGQQPPEDRREGVDDAAQDVGKHHARLTSPAPGRSPSPRGDGTGLAGARSATTHGAPRSSREPRWRTRSRKGRSGRATSVRCGPTDERGTRTRRMRAGALTSRPRRSLVPWLRSLGSSVPGKRRRVYRVRHR